MMTTLPIPVRRVPSALRRFLRRSAWVFLIGLSLSRPLFGQQPTPQPPPPAPPTAQPGIQVQSAIAAEPTPVPEILPLNEDPNDPTASQEVRMERQKALIQKRITERMEMLKRAANQPTPTPAPRATPPPPGAAAKSPVTLEKREPSYVTLFLSPPELTLQTHQRFSTQCRLYNEDHLPVDRIDIDLTYPSQAIKLVAIHQNRLQAMLDGQPECRVDEKAGTLVYRARLLRPVAGVDLELLTLVWEARVPTEEAMIKPAIGAHLSQVFGGRKLLNTGKRGMEDALVGTVLRIDGPAGAAPQGNRYIDLGNQQLRLAGFRDQHTLRPPRLWIHQPEKGMLQPGKWLVVDLGVDNPDGAVFDEVRLAAAFDPDAVEIQDSDRGNWITAGVNLLDGPFHRDWPWDNLYRNEVDRSRGYFYYRMGMNDLREQPSGTFARLFVRVKRPIQAPIFTWLWSEQRDAAVPATGLYLFGTNIYRRLLKNDPGDPLGVDAIMAAQGPTPGVEKADPAIYRTLNQP